MQRLKNDMITWEKFQCLNKNAAQMFDLSSPGV